MKFVELKKNLAKEIKPIYIVEGADRFVVGNAVKLIEKSLNLVAPEINKIVIENNKTNSVENVLDVVSSYPMMDEKKLVILKDFSLLSDAKKLEAYFKAPNDFVVLVVVSYEPSEFTKKLKPYAEELDANSLDETTIKNWIGARLKQENKTIEEKAINKLVLYTSCNLTRIETEIQKLIAASEEVVTSKLVEEYILPDKDYQIYELTEFLAKNEREKVFDLINFMLSEDKNNVGLIQYLYGSFRRLLIISLSASSDEKLAQELGIKPFAVKKARVQAAKFTPKKLKKINNELSKLEHGIKSGKFNQDAGLCVALCKILLD